VPFAYKLFLTNQARKELAKIQKGNLKAAQAISNALNQLEYDPDAGEFLHGDLKGRRKLRAGNYRIVYSIEKKNLIILIFRIAHRKEAYR